MPGRTRTFTPVTNPTTTQYVTVGYSVDDDAYRVEIYTLGDPTVDEIIEVDGEPTEHAACLLAGKIAAERGLRAYEWNGAVLADEDDGVVLKVHTVGDVRAFDWPAGSGVAVYAGEWWLFWTDGRPAEWTNQDAEMATYPYLGRVLDLRLPPTEN
jgi:hypothetical protein